ncbi:MAG: hypothetical protein AB8B94_12190 [Hyphomicrobiales bacterium]
MPKPEDETAQYSYRKRSFLPRTAQDTCFRLGVALGSGTIQPDQIAAFRECLLPIAAKGVPQAAMEIREIAQLHRNADIVPAVERRSFLWPFSKQTTGTSKLLNQYPQLLDKFPDLGWLLMYHGNGFVRQAAIAALNDAPQCPFELSAVVYRLNDWVENVRLAAIEYCENHLANTSADVLAESAFFLIPQARILHRWDKEGQRLLEEALYRPDVVEKLKDKFLGIRTGRVGHVFRQCLSRNDFDQYLLELSSQAAMPTIRAIAIEALLTQRARWFVKRQKQWVDKRYNVSKHVAVIESRPIDIVVDVETLLETAASDRSSHVRKVAADVLIERRHDASDRMNRIANLLLSDPNAAVRSRAEFFQSRNNK